MCPGLTADLQKMEDARKTAVIDRELAQLNVDIACLQETRMPDSGTIKEANYTFCWKGRPSDEPRLHGVSFAVKNTLVASTEILSAGTERILVLRLLTLAGPVSIISAYTPTLCSSPEVKDQFYKALDKEVSRIHSTERLYLLGDFNARVGVDHKSSPTCLGPHGRGKINENGQRLLELCCFQGLCVTITFVKCKEIHQVSWRHPRSHHWHQLDLVITRRSDLGSVLLTRSYHSTDCDTDHSIIASRVRITPKKLHHLKKKGGGHPCINTCCISDPEKTQQFVSNVEKALEERTPVNGTIDSWWIRLCDVVYGSAIGAYGKAERKNAYWYEAHWEDMEPMTEAKRKALLAYKATPSPIIPEALRAAKKTAQQTACHCANTYWQNLCRSIQTAAKSGNV